MSFTPSVLLSGSNAVPLGLSNHGANVALADRPPYTDMTGSEGRHILTGANATVLGRGRTVRQPEISYADKARATVSNDRPQAQASASSSFPRRPPHLSLPKVVA